MRQATLSLHILETIMKLPEDRPSSAGFVSRPISAGSSSSKMPVSLIRVPIMQFSSRSISVASAGERVGIIGKIGSGKTTIGRVLSGLYTPTVGAVADRWHRCAAIPSCIGPGLGILVGQSADLFSGTLKENLLMAKPDATDDEIIAARRRPALTTLRSCIRGDMTCRLASGQQSVRRTAAGGCLARMFLAKPKIVFLDEPTGSMDLASEKLLIANLATAFDRDINPCHLHPPLQPA